MEHNRPASPALVLGGLTWTAAAAVGLGAHGLRFSTAEALWIASDAAILWGLGRLASRNFGTVARRGLVLALFARVLFIAAEVVSIVQRTDDNLLLPIAAVLTAIGMTVYGTAVARRADRSSLSRFAALAVGVYPFLVMFPFVAITGQPNTAAIAGWGIATAVLGAASLPSPRRVEVQSRAGRSRKASVR